MLSTTETSVIGQASAWAGVQIGDWRCGEMDTLWTEESWNHEERTMSLHFKLILFCFINQSRNVGPEGSHFAEPHFSTLMVGIHFPTGPGTPRNLLEGRWKIWLQRRTSSALLCLVCCHHNIDKQCKMNLLYIKYEQFSGLAYQPWGIGLPCFINSIYGHMTTNSWTNRREISKGKV